MSSEWHPIFYTSEPSPGVWTMRAPGDDAPFGRIELRRTEGGPRYKVTLGQDVIGWATSIQVASERLWVARLEVMQRGRDGPPNGGR